MSYKLSELQIFNASVLHQKYLFKWPYSLLLMQHLCFQRSQLYFLLLLLDFWDLFLTMCVCGLSVISVYFHAAMFRRVEGVLAFWVEMVYMLKPLAPSVWLCVHCSAVIEKLLSSWWKKGCNADCNCSVDLWCTLLKCEERALIDSLYILFMLTFHLYMRKMSTKKLASNVNESVVLN